MLTEVVYIVLQQAAFVFLALMGGKSAHSTRWFPLVFNFGFALASFELAYKLNDALQSYWFGFAGLAFLGLGASLFLTRGRESSKQSFLLYYLAYNVLVYVGYALSP